MEQEEVREISMGQVQVQVQVLVLVLVQVLVQVQVQGQRQVPQPEEDPKEQALLLHPHMARDLTGLHTARIHRLVEGPQPPHN